LAQILPTFPWKKSLINVQNITGFIISLLNVSLPDRNTKIQRKPLYVITETDNISLTLIISPTHKTNFVPSYLGLGRFGSTLSHFPSDNFISDHIKRLTLYLSFCRPKPTSKGVHFKRDNIISDHISRFSLYSKVIRPKKRPRTSKKK
jgi:hypothetical protein